jgi:hypothetical protein
VSKEYDYDPGFNEGWLYLAAMRVLLGRLACPNNQQKQQYDLLETLLPFL